MCSSNIPPNTIPCHVQQVSHTKTNQIFWLFSEGCAHCNVLFSVNPKKQRKDLNNEYSTINITQGNRLNETGQPCSVKCLQSTLVCCLEKLKLLVLCQHFSYDQVCWQLCLIDNVLSKLNVLNCVVLKSTNNLRVDT